MGGQSESGEENTMFRSFTFSSGLNSEDQDMGWVVVVCAKVQGQD